MPYDNCRTIRQRFYACYIRLLIILKFQPLREFRFAGKNLGENNQEKDLNFRISQVHILS